MYLLSCANATIKVINSYCESVTEVLNKYCEEDFKKVSKCTQSGCYEKHNVLLHNGEDSDLFNIWVCLCEAIVYKL